MALGDFIKTIFNNNMAPPLNSTNLNNMGDKLEELDQWAVGEEGHNHDSDYSDISHSHTAADIGAMKLTALASLTDLDTVVDAGSYRLGTDHVNTPSANDCSYGQLLVIRGGGDTVAQLIFDYHSGFVATRQGNDAYGTGTWTEWKQVASQGDNVTFNNITADEITADQVKVELYVVK